MKESSEMTEELHMETTLIKSGILGRYSQICTFLAGIFFTCIMLIVQQKEKFDYELEIVGFRVRAVDMISLPLTVTFLLFVFDAFIFATASQSDEHARMFRNRAVYLFYSGVIIMLISLFSILVQISLWLAFIGVVTAIVLTLYWGWR
jgi:hypothetical protein